MKVGFHNEENLNLNQIDAKIFIIIKPFRGLLSMPFQGIKYLSPPIPPYASHNTITRYQCHNFTTRSSPHMEEFSLLLVSSLPRVSEVFTPIAQNHMKQEQETRRKSMITFKHNIQNSRNTHMLLHNTCILSQHEDIPSKLLTRRKKTQWIMKPTFLQTMAM